MKTFASSGDLAEKEQTLEVIADGVYALTAEGDPNVGAIEGEDFLVCFEAMATPVAASGWLARLRERTGKPIRYLVLSHYHAVRVLGASASASIPGLTWPTATFSDRFTIALGGDRGDLVLAHFGRGHTEGDIVAWLPRQKILFAGDLVESQAALYTGDAFHRDWRGGTLNAVAALGAESLVGGRGAVAHGTQAVAAAIGQTRDFLDTMLAQVGAVHAAGGTLKEAFAAAHGALAPRYGRWPIFEHCMPFNVSRLWDELAGIERPVIWTAERDRQVWEQLRD